MSYMKSGVMLLMLSLSLLSVLSLSGCTSKQIVTCKPIKLDKWITEEPKESLDLEKKLTEALSK